MVPLKIGHALNLLNRSSVKITTRVPLNKLHVMRKTIKENILIVFYS